MARFLLYETVKKAVGLFSNKNPGRNLTLFFINLYIFLIYLIFNLKTNMKFCYEKRTGCCGCPIHNMTNTALCHYLIYGIYVCAFVFSNNCYPPLYYVDYMYGGSSAVLMLLSIVGIFVSGKKKCQPLRFLCALLIFFNVFLVVVATYMYTVMRWNDIEVTAITLAFRRPAAADFSDHLWYTFTVIACLECPVFLIYLIYILSYLCNPWKSHLFTDTFDDILLQSPFTPSITVPVIPPSNAYPTTSYKY